jgi:uncharacterized protein YgbK (DUF1537 family)
VSLALGIIADDFTGALLVAGELEAAGVECPVLFSPGALKRHEAASVAMLATRARIVEPTQAVAMLREGADMFAKAGCRRLAYKACATFDSTEAGNIGLAADFLSEQVGGRPAFMSAGAPVFNVTVFQGHLFYRGTLVSESVKRFDPLTPMTDPNLVRFLSKQTERGVALLQHTKLAKGIAAARLALAEVSAAGNHILADTADDMDVEISAQLAMETGAPIVASDALIIAYARMVAATAAARLSATPRHLTGPAAVLVGSVGPIALGHLARFEAQHPVLRLRLEDPRPEAEIVAAAMAWVAPHFGNVPFAVTTAEDQAGVARNQQAFGAIGAARKAEVLLAAVAKALHAKGIRRLVVAGGETSGAVVGALRLTRARAHPAGPLGGGFCVAEGPDGAISLFLKSGKLGADDILASAIDAMSP